MKEYTQNNAMAKESVKQIKTKFKILILNSIPDEALHTPGKPSSQGTFIQQVFLNIPKYAKLLTASPKF